MADKFTFEIAEEILWNKRRNIFFNCQREQTICTWQHAALFLPLSQERAHDEIIKPLVLKVLIITSLENKLKNCLGLIDTHPNSFPFFTEEKNQRWPIHLSLKKDSFYWIFFNNPPDIIKTPLDLIYIPSGTID